LGNFAKNDIMVLNLFVLSYSDAIKNT